MGDPTESEGTRVLLAMEILKFVIHDPVAGSGYFGLWALPNALERSAHNQYMDVLFRTGFLGFVACGFLVIHLLEHLRNHEQSLFRTLLASWFTGCFMCRLSNRRVRLLGVSAWSDGSTVEKQEDPGPRWKRQKLFTAIASA